VTSPPLDAVHAGLDQWGQQMPDGASDVDHQILAALMQRFGGGPVTVGQVGLECRGRDKLAIKIVWSQNHLTWQLGYLLYQALQFALQDADDLLYRWFAQQQQAFTPTQDFVQHVGIGAARDLDGEHPVVADQRLPTG
jgi:hypothetical protein